ncbi:hypothetical protein GUITHDRAFT_141985 [Guillardia theta CCMP2712]|uniref:TORTIFOLIA1/SINE1-2 N-terminal domain-containing protein n=1 Tax=Guillardia theta (strain CCMP2712) TaxID=905079 RepID=L1J013_GUITC|nr:hypothetical protein GUITHDRAFT_141985 [Guillardia theta CCMP2712]EKX41504.1 hypothetical protein GUITHDRAFT_141985 [Guillardia theta CCMP2712]|eukprot:XP_005828484.1 hypothetical protein GUITHDRAFT_141985 [Guillardia theta CCMP2712]
MSEKGNWKMEFDMTEGVTPRGRAAGDAKKKAMLESMKQELKLKAGKALSKLVDRDTQSNGLAEFHKICDDLKPEFVSSILSLLFEFDGGKSAWARAQGARLFATVAKLHFNMIQGSLGRIVSFLCKKMRDTDANVREACAETVGELSRLLNSSEPFERKLEETMDMDSSTMNDAPTLGLFFRPILQSLESADPNAQQGCSLAFAHVIFNCGSQLHPHLEKLSKRILALMDNNQFQGKPQLLIAIANLIEVCPDGLLPFMPLYFARIRASCSSQDWNTRKSAIETLEAMFTRYEPAQIMDYKNSIFELLDKCRYDRQPPVREVAAQALQQISKIEGLSRDGGGSKKDDDWDVAEADDLENQDPFPQASMEDLSLSRSSRTPLQSIQASSIKAELSKPDMSMEQNTRAKPANVLSATWGSAAPAQGYVPSKEAWDQLLVHFDRITQQQTQLIEMVSGFSEQARERLETLEQKVFSLDLRMSSIDHRQSLSGMPPTPARAIGTPSKNFACTPSRGISTPMNTCHENAGGWDDVDVF